MSLLFPAYLLGLFGLALPWLLHRFSDQRPEEQLFPSRRFLEPTAPPVSRKRTLRYRLLLALRVLSLALLCFLFAQPWLNKALNTGDSRLHHVVAIDQSLSMRAEGRWQSALDQANSVVEQISDSDSIDLVGFDNETRILATGENARSDALRSFAQLEPGFAAADYGNLMQRINSMAAEKDIPVKVWLISDEQQSALPAQLNALYAPQVSELEILSVVDEPQQNFHLSAQAQSSDSVNVRIAATVSASRSDTAQESLSRTLRVLYQDQILAERQLLVPTGSLESVVIDDIVLPAVQNPVLRITLVEPDALLEDNSIRLPVRRANPTSLALLENDKDGSRNAAVYLSTAFETDSLAIVEAVAGNAERIPPETQHLVTGRVLKSSDIELDVLQFVDTGRNALVFNQSGNAGSRSNAISGQAVGLVDDAHPLALGEIDWFGTEFFDIGQFVPLPDDRVLLETTERVAILIERQTPRGRLMVLNDSLDGLSSNLPFQPAFVDLMQSILRYFDASTALPEQVVVGNRIALPGNVQILDPAGESLLTLDDNARSGGIQLTQPGLFTVVGVRGDHSLQVILDSKEADFASISTNDMDAWQARYTDEIATSVDGKVESPARTRPVDVLTLAQGADASRYALWQIVLPLLAAVLFFESWIGNRRLDVRRDGS